MTTGAHLLARIRKIAGISTVLLLVAGAPVAIGATRHWRIA